MPRRTMKRRGSTRRAAATGGVSWTCSFVSVSVANRMSLLLGRPGRLRQSGVVAIVGVELGNDLVGLLVHEGERHPRYVCARVGAGARLRVGDYSAIGSGQRE